MASTKAAKKSTKAKPKKEAPVKSSQSVTKDVSKTYDRLVKDLKRDGETKLDLEKDVAPLGLDEPAAKMMMNSAAYRAGFADKITIRKRKGVLTGKLDKE